MLFEKNHIILNSCRYKIDFLASQTELDYGIALTNRLGGLDKFEVLQIAIWNGAVLENFLR